MIYLEIDEVVIALFIPFIGIEFERKTPEWLGAKYEEEPPFDELNDYSYFRDHLALWASPGNLTLLFTARCREAPLVVPSFIHS
ncbi:MAG: hypothetical protein U5K69_11655 [Balneolaceae bacterium]|nr:hypothetical protein [Balneolaceae bacterium]